MALANRGQEAMHCGRVPRSSASLYIEYLFRCTDLCYVDLADTVRRILANASGQPKSLVITIQWYQMARLAKC